MIIQTSPQLPAERWPGDGVVESWPIFAVGVHRLHAGVSAAVLTGWQYTKSGNNSGRTLTNYVRTAWNWEEEESAVSVRVQESYRRIVDLPQARDAAQVFEPRVIRIHALYLHAMWLHSLSGKPDVVIPHMSYVPDLVEGAQYPLATFLQVAKREAAKLPPPPPLAGEARHVPLGNGPIFKGGGKGDAQTE